LIIISHQYSSHLISAILTLAAIYVPYKMSLYIYSFFSFFPLAYQGHGCGRQSNPQEQSGTQSTFAAGTEAGKVAEWTDADRVFKLNHVVI
jgi:hypothetical protein